ncbi:MAG: hypothetical protein JO289_13425, partial [Xanthobacteraceae bacterium]|nr:hypothetical protein [Xanthobacteraceae bacterium]
KLASELAAKPTTARSISDVMAAYQECGTRHLEMIGGETKHFLDDAQKLMQSGAQAALTNWLSNGSGFST